MWVYQLEWVGKGSCQQWGNLTNDIWQYLLIFNLCYFFHKTWANFENSGACIWLTILINQFLKFYAYLYWLEFLSGYSYKYMCRNSTVLIKFSCWINLLWYLLFSPVTLPLFVIDYLNSSINSKKLSSVYYLALKIFYRWFYSDYTRPPPKKVFW